MIAEPIYYLFKKGMPWNWGLEQDLAMSALKTALTTAPALVKIIYTDGAGEIILAVDASLKGWGAVLMQLDDQGKRHPSRYESGLWNQAEQNYDATKRECRGVLKALRKVRYWLYGVRFVLETDANVLVAQLNRSATDLPGALVTRWIAYIRLFDFVVRHVPGNKHTATDGLSRRPRTESDDIDEANEVDIDDFIDAEINAFQVAPITAEEVDGHPKSTRNPPKSVASDENLLEDGYSEGS
jgi:ribonuclease HI